MLSDIAPEGATAKAAAVTLPDTGPDLRQDSVDALLGSDPAVDPSLGQTDVDQLFA
jgi:hypothetical protein